MAADCGVFQAQIAAIMETLANSAVAEICKLVEDGFAALRSQMDRDRDRDRSQKENEALRQKLREMNMKLRSYEKRMRRRSHFRSAETDERPSQTRPPVPSEDSALHHVSKLQDDKNVHTPVKQETLDGDDCNLDLKVELNIRAECALQQSAPSHAALDAGVSSPDLPSPPVDTTTCQSRRERPADKSPGSSSGLSGGGVQAPEDVLRGSGGGLSEGALKTETPAADGAEEEPPQANVEGLSSLEMDLSWMQERVSHLGAAYAVAQLGLGGTDPPPPSASFPAQAGGDAAEAAPGLLFPSGAHEMLTFATSFDLVPPPRPTAPSATPSDQRRPHRSGRSAAKEPMACAACGRVFPTAAMLEQHHKVHTGERPYTCPHCGKGFAQPHNLRVHLHIHTGERRYRCTLCGKSFISSSHLKRHRTVHTQEKPYSCSRCGQSFSQMCSVRRHRQQSQCGL